MRYRFQLPSSCVASAPDVCQPLLFRLPNILFGFIDFITVSAFRRVRSKCVRDYCDVLDSAINYRRCQGLGRTRRMKGIQYAPVEVVMVSQNVYHVEETLLLRLPSHKFKLFWFLLLDPISWSNRYFFRCAQRT